MATCEEKVKIIGELAVKEKKYRNDGNFSGIFGENFEVAEVEAIRDAMQQQVDDLFDEFYVRGATFKEELELCHSELENGEQSIFLKIYEHFTKIHISVIMAVSFDVGEDFD